MSKYHEDKNVNKLAYNIWITCVLDGGKLESSTQYKIQKLLESELTAAIQVQSKAESFEEGNYTPRK